MIADLSELLRRSLQDRDKPEIPLAQEVEFLRLYLGIQHARFQERLIFGCDISDGAASVMVPDMILQPLVENSVQHAIAPRREGGRIEIRAQVRENELCIEVEDFGGEPPRLPFADGLGLRNTRERLRGRYGEASRFEMIPASEGLLVRLSIPAAP